VRGALPAARRAATRTPIASLPRPVAGWAAATCCISPATALIRGRSGSTQHPAPTCFFRSTGPNRAPAISPRKQAAAGVDAGHRPSPC